ncbi:hypothetical protein ACFY04_43380 [Streptomyces sp. NPDC001549]|uniref:hypothetical protein n=1 Tax=Streptomyces sp. NPDC001549 TaxID=3364586 RepID=UPI0036C1632D
MFAVELPADRSPLQMDALEVTQAVQDLGHSVPLVAQKRTVVRAYLSFYGSAPVTVRGELSVRSAPTATPVVIASENTVTLNPADAGNITPTRNDAARSLNFVLPLTSTLAGQLAIRLSSVSDVATGNPMAVGNERRPTVSFHDGPPLRLQVIGFSYQWGLPPTTTTHTPRDIDYLMLDSWLLRAYPVARVRSGAVREVAASATPPFTSDDINAQLAAIRAQDVNAGTDARTHYYGLVGDGGFWMRGSAASVPAANPDPRVVACGPAGVPGSSPPTASFTWDTDDSYGDWYGGHELGHTLGRLHPGFCPNNSTEDRNNYPFAAGQLSTNDAGFAGFDVGHPGLGGDPTRNLPMIALPEPSGTMS